MALPPERLERVLPSAVVVVVGNVSAVVDLGSWPVPSRGPPDSGHKSPAQQVTLKVARVLRGNVVVDAEVVVTKPEGAYAVNVGTHGAWLLDGSAVILGRYGPDTWGIDDVVAAIVASDNARAS